MYVNNEIGVIQDIPALGELLRSRGVLFHVDSAQATGKLPIDLGALKVDLMSFSAHRPTAPRGSARSTSGASRGCASRRRSTAGTRARIPFRHAATHQIVAWGEAFRIAGEEMAAENERVRMLRDRLMRGLTGMEEVHLNGHLERRVPHT